MCVLSFIRPLKLHYVSLARYWEEGENDECKGVTSILVRQGSSVFETSTPNARLLVFTTLNDSLISNVKQQNWNTKNNSKNT